MRSRVSKFIRLLQCAGWHWSEDNASSIGAALAFYCAFSIAPLLVILLTLAGLVVDEKNADAHVSLQLTALFGPATAQVLLEAVHSAREVRGSVATVVSIITLMIGATTVLTALQSALEIIWQSQKLARTGIRGWMLRRVLSFGFILAIGFLLLVSLTLSAALAHLQTRVAARYPELVGTISFGNTLLSLVLTAGLFALIYRFMPTRRLAWPTVAAGALLTAVLFEVGRWGIGLYLARSTQPSAFGAASSFAALLLWLYYTAQIFLFGAEFTACLGGVRAQNRRPDRR
ncbi:MAG TPA: YihY/virulence factor BrkB family protein [Steroidobacteraceae bacterium]|nr:YihY/virulence factor BrkB family protein [Steroidobacteraceae bacterium]